jgi:hypothetical protein
VLHNPAEDKLEACRILLAKSALPPLWKPRADQFDWLIRCRIWAQANLTCRVAKKSRPKKRSRISDLRLQLQNYFVFKTTLLRSSPAMMR